MPWEVEYSDEFGAWWDRLEEPIQDAVAVVVTNLERLGPALPHPYSSGVTSSKHGHMRELRIQHRGKPIRVFYAFDPRRTAILLIGGLKNEGDRFYRKLVPIADRLLDRHLQVLAGGGRDDG